MSIVLTRVYAILIAALAVVGLFVNGHLFQFMNTDIALDLLRVVLAVYLIYVGFISKNERMSHTALTIVGWLYIVMGVVGIFSSTLGGILPTGLTGFDIAFHLVTGVLAAAVGMRHGRSASTAHA